MTVTGTYRLQLHAGFGFADAEAILPYLGRLGISHLYLSPILAATPGSMHGYDVVDHTRLSDALGGRAGFVSLAEAAASRGLGIVVDVVPNHMAFVAPEWRNRPLWELLTDGRDASTADWFDVDWKAGGGRIGLPVLGEDLESILADGQLVVDELELPEQAGSPQPVIRYHDHVYPIALGTEGDARPGDADPATVRAVLERQHYRLTNWRERDEVLNYRRFFEVDGLIAVRVELPAVFAATHALLLDLNARGLIDGFRIDHPDGLADPQAYLAQLRRAARRGTHIWVEKILEGGEELPASWACDGTTGYDGLRAIQAALVDAAAAPTLTRVWQEAGGESTLLTAVEAAKRQVVDQSLGPEVERLTRRAREVLRELDPERLRAAIVELLIGGEVYRAYVRPEEALSPDARRRLANALSRAAQARPDLEPELRALVPLAVPPQDASAQALDFSVRLQQTWGPVMAKGVEDTTFYRWHRLIALAEVGGDPDDLDHGGPDVLFRWAARQQRDWPTGLVAGSTHDTKRSEDVRARILAVAADPVAWQECSRIARERARDFDVDAPTAHLLWQTLLGVGMISHDRLQAYLLKAVREAKRHTAWVDGDEAYERRVIAFADAVRHSGPLHDAIERALADGAESVRATTLAGKALALTVPGIPDIYQGCEIVNLSLVDPDNRRPVDYETRAALLDRIDRAAAFIPRTETGPGAAAPTDVDASRPADVLDAEKLLLVSRVLRLRRAEPDLFGAHASFTPLWSDGDHAFGFVRAAPVGRLAGALGLGRERRLLVLVTRAVGRLRAAGGWDEATVAVPEGTWRDILTDRVVAGGSVPCADLLTTYPVAILLQD